MINPPKMDILIILILNPNFDGFTWVQFDFEWLNSTQFCGSTTGGLSTPPPWAHSPFDRKPWPRSHTPARKSARWVFMGISCKCSETKWWGQDGSGIFHGDLSVFWSPSWRIFVSKMGDSIKPQWFSHGFPRWPLELDPFQGPSSSAPRPWRADHVPEILQGTEIEIWSTNIGLIQMCICTFTVINHYSMS